jgi:uncharacterized protein YdaU (DUF1376 family)
MRRWYKRCPSDFIMATMKLTLEEKGAYSLCLDLMYDRGGPIPDDPRWLAGICNVSLRKWATLRDSLIAYGKLVERNGFLTNERAEEEIASAEKSSRERAESGSKGGRTRAQKDGGNNKNSDLGEAEVKREEKIRGDTDANASGGEPPSDPPVDPIKAIFDLGVALLVDEKTTPAAARSLIGRWRKDHGDGFVLEAVNEAKVRDISQPKEWITAWLKRRAGASPGLFGGDDLERKYANAPPRTVELPH